MNEKELTHFERQVKLSGLTKAEFLRGLIKKVEIKSRLAHILIGPICITIS